MYIYHGPPKPTFLEVVMGNNLGLMDAHGIYASHVCFNDTKKYRILTIKSCNMQYANSTCILYTAYTRKETNDIRS